MIESRLLVQKVLTVIQELNNANKWGPYLLLLPVSTDLKGVYFGETNLEDRLKQIEGVKVIMHYTDSETEVVAHCLPGEVKKKEKLYGS